MDKHLFLGKSKQEILTKFHQVYYLSQKSDYRKNKKAFNLSHSFLCHLRKVKLLSVSATEWIIHA